jgi:hypothetical protein
MLVDRAEKAEEIKKAHVLYRRACDVVCGALR